VTRPRIIERPSLLPKLGRGRPSTEAKAAYLRGVKKFCKLVMEIRSTMDFDVGSRGWCYILEPHGLRKGDFDAAQKLITECRKLGEERGLPLDICAEDDSRATIGLEDIDDNDIPAEVEWRVGYLRNSAHKHYTPISFWDDLDVYVEVAVEKLDLRNLFEPVCEEFHVPITNFKGWSDLNSRAAMMRRFREHKAQGRECKLLLCGDHDPGGLLITDTMRENMNGLKYAVGWVPTPDNLLITRFGLNTGFINEHRLTWIDNLETSSGEDLGDSSHPDHCKDYVQDYIRRFGVHKCEANALVVEPEIGRQLCRGAILNHIPAAAVERYESKLERVRLQLRTALRERVS
jgi:hypothetical protein